MSEGTRFDPERLFAEIAYASFARAAVRAVETGSVASLAEALGAGASEADSVLAAFAVSTQGLSPLLARLPGAGDLSALLSAFLAGEAERSAARARVLRKTLTETVALLRSAGVEIVALKGAALAFRDYPDPALRPMGDLDLLLRNPSDLPRATEALERKGGWRALFDTSRHRVFARPDERVARPAAEDPENPVRLEIHRSFRLPILGRAFDASAQLRAETETMLLDGVCVHVPAASATQRHLLLHAAEDFSGLGLRGVQAHDFRLLSLSGGPLSVTLSPEDRRAGVAPLSYAAHAVQGLFPDCFEPEFLRSLDADAPEDCRARAATLPPLRYTRPRRGWTLALLPLIESPARRVRFLARTLFPPPGEVRANAAADGSSLGSAYVQVTGRRLSALFRRG